MDFEYSVDATDLTTGTWIDVDALDFITPDTGTVGAKNGNAAGERTAIGSTITGLSIASGACVWIRWFDFDATGADDGLAVDDFSHHAEPRAAGFSLTINDVSLNEGNAGTTTFTFTVSLSLPAPAGGVTFDIATANGTASRRRATTPPSRSPARRSPRAARPTPSTSWSTATRPPRPNETFFVNVTNVTGAIVGDGQGQGTIVNDDSTVAFIHDVQGAAPSRPSPARR